MSAYFGTNVRSSNRADASSNVTIGDMGTANKFSIRITTGVSKKVFVDVCGLGTAVLLDLDANGQRVGNTLKLRADVYTNDDVFINSYVTPALYLNDISAVAGTLVNTITNEGRKLAGAENLPMYFRTICGEVNKSSNRAIRMVLKDDDKIKNGYKVSLLANVDLSTVNLSGTASDMSFSAITTNYPQVLVNGGPLGADQAVPEFIAEMKKNATTATTGDIYVYTQVPMFKNGGEGIDLSSVTFRLREEAVNGSEDYYTITIPSSEKNNLQLPNQDGLYEYNIGNKTNANGKSYRLMATNVVDKFLTYGYAMQNSLNNVINIDNIPSAITQSGIRINADASGQDATFRTGTKAVVTFATPTTADGDKSLLKYEARWASRAQIASLGDVPINFNVLEANFPNQVNIQTDICSTTGALFPNVTLTGLTPSVMNADGTSDNNTRYGVFVRAYTQDDNGNPVAGKDGATDVSLSAWLGKSAAMENTATDVANVSLGFFVSGVPDAPTPVSVRTGKDVLLTTTNTTTDTLKDASMNNNLVLVYNDYNVNQRGSNYDSVRYAIVRAKDVSYAADMPDASFATGTGAWNGNDSVAESLVIAGAGANTMVYENGAWATRANDLSNGETFAISYAFDNSNGIGFRAPWVNFTPTTHADASSSLYALDVSTNTRTSVTGAGWGYGVGAAGSAAAGGAAAVDNSGTFIGMTAALKEKRYNVSQNNGAIGFGFSLLDLSGINNKKAGLAYKSPALLDGGSEVTSIRYFVAKSAAAATNGTASVDNVTARTYGQPQRDVSATSAAPLTAAFALSSSANKDTNRLVVSKSYDPSGALTNLKVGQRYDICFGLVNANGYNDLSMSLLRGFAPMGEIQAVKNLRLGAQAPVMGTNASTASTTQTYFDISFDDLSGAAEHGGHLINKYNYTVTQYQGDVSGTVTLVNNQNITSANTASYQKANATSYRGLYITSAVAATALPGYPMKVTVTAESVVSSTPADNDVRLSNYYHNVGGVNKVGAAATITIPGPKFLASTADDEVRALVVAPADGKLNVSFYKPQSDTIKDIYQGAPSINAYYIYQYDMSLNTLGGTSERAMSRTVKVLSDINTLQADRIETSIDGINGKAYVVAVHTQWRYGVNNDTLQVSKGVYHTNLASSTAINDPSFNNGLYTLPADARIITSGIRLADCAIPAGAPSIYADNNSMRFDDNGSQISLATMIQVSPQSGSPAGQPVNTTAFYLDLCGTANSVRIPGTTTIDQLTDQLGHAINRRTYDISQTAVLGANWANEKNFVVIQNSAGSAYVKRNIE